MNKMHNFDRERHFNNYINIVSFIQSMTIFIHLSNYITSIISDVDECSVMNPCATSTNCVNTPGSYKCVCYGSLSEPNCAAGMNINILHTNMFVFIYDVLQLIVSNLQLIVSYLKLIVSYFKLSVCY